MKKRSHEYFLHQKKRKKKEKADRPTQDFFGPLQETILFF